MLYGKANILTIKSGQTIRQYTNWVIKDSSLHIKILINAVKEDIFTENYAIVTPDATEILYFVKDGTEFDVTTSLEETAFVNGKYIVKTYLIAGEYNTVLEKKNA